MRLISLRRDDLDERFPGLFDVLSVWALAGAAGRPINMINLRSSSTKNVSLFVDHVVPVAEQLEGHRADKPGPGGEPTGQRRVKQSPIVKSKINYILSGKHCMFLSGIPPLPLY